MHKIIFYPVGNGDTSQIVLALKQLGLPIPRGLLLDANLVVEAAGALLVCALVVLVETWCWWMVVSGGLRVRLDAECR